MIGIPMLVYISCILLGKMGRPTILSGQTTCDFKQLFSNVHIYIIFHAHILTYIHTNTYSIQQVPYTNVCWYFLSVVVYVLTSVGCWPVTRGGECDFLCYILFKQKKTFQVHVLFHVIDKRCEIKYPLSFGFIQNTSNIVRFLQVIVRYQKKQQVTLNCYRLQYKLLCLNVSKMIFRRTAFISNHTSKHLFELNMNDILRYRF